MQFILDAFFSYLLVHSVSPVVSKSNQNWMAFTHSACAICMTGFFQQAKQITAKASKIDMCPRGLA